MKEFSDIQTREIGLQKSLTAGQLSMIALGGAIGTGLFLGSKFAIGFAGPSVIVSYLIGGAIALMQVAQALAIAAGRAFVVPDDIKLIRHQVLRHRLVRTFDALANNVTSEELINAIFDSVPTP